MTEYISRKMSWAVLYWRDFLVKFKTEEGSSWRYISILHSCTFCEWGDGGGRGGHWLFNYIDTKAKCHLKNWPVMGLCGRCLSVCPLPSKVFVWGGLAILLVLNSNGKSSIVEERLYSFFFAFFPKKRSFVFSLFPFYTIINEDVRFASIL
jgi:hypothetical protein